VFGTHATEVRIGPANPLQYETEEYLVICKYFAYFGNTFINAVRTTFGGCVGLDLQQKRKDHFLRRWVGLGYRDLMGTLTD
jgi:hypothetical protein